MPGAFETLVKTTNGCVVAPILDGIRVPIELQAIYVKGLRERVLHNASDAFVEVCVVGESEMKFKTEVSSSPTSPRWKLKRAIGIAVSPSSVIRFTVHRHHRVLDDEIIGVVEGTAWTFLKDNKACHNVQSTDSPNMTLQAIVDIADAEHKEIRRNSIDAELKGEEDRLMALDRLHGQQASDLIQKMIIEVLMHLGSICTILDAMSDIPLCKTVSTLLRLVQAGLRKMLEKRQQVNEHMATLLKSLLETVSSAAQSEQQTLQTEVINLAGHCAELLDRWISHNLAAQLAHALIGVFDDRFKAFDKQAKELHEKLAPSKPATFSAEPESDSEHEWPSSPESDSCPLTPPPIHTQLNEVFAFTINSPWQTYVEESGRKAEPSTQQHDQIATEIPEVQLFQV